jgi:glycerophosphoryl diester phosphodiesterase
LTEGNPVAAIPVAKELSAVAINPNYKTLNTSNVKEIKDNGFKVFTWTVNEEKDIVHMQELGVDGIFTNYPERAR